MKSITCTRCGKIMEGYTMKQILMMLKQHMLTHEIDEDLQKVNKHETEIPM